MIVPENPFQRLITACEDNPTVLRHHYEAHRTTRNVQYRATILSPTFSGWQTDQILRKLHENSYNGESQFIDTRNNLAIWARPPRHIRELVAEIQQEIRNVAPTMWFTPPECLHMTTLEITNSQTPSEIDALVSHLEKSGVVSDIVNYTFTHRTGLVKPMVSYDATAIALSFVPAAVEGDDQTGRGVDDAYTYHYLRRDLFDRVTATGIQMNTRYTVPSAHITIARFITQEGFQLEEAGPDGCQVDGARVKTLVEKMDRINHKLKERHWDGGNGKMPPATEWVVGQEKGLDFRKGRSWYGGGETLVVGEGFG